MYSHPLFESLWKYYTEQNPHAKSIYDLLVSQGEIVENDHVAFRTCNHEKINIDVLGGFFRELGYKERDTYMFPNKRLKAKYYLHPDPTAPKVFISELLMEQFYLKVQEILNRCIDQISAFDSPADLYSGTHWPLLWDEYEYLHSQSEYAAWFYAFGFCANHFTVNVDALKHFKDIYALNSFLKDHGHVLNESGGEVKGTPDDYLEQSSTMAGKTEVAFDNGTHEIPTCYYEFAKRYNLPNGERFQGFVTDSADKIFESTDNK